MAWTEAQKSVYVTPAERNLPAAEVDALILVEQRKINDLEYSRGMATRTAPFDRAIDFAQTRIHMLQYVNDPNWAARYEAAAAAANSGDFFSRIGDTIVSAVPIALAVTGAYFLAPIAFEAAAGTASTGSAAGTGAVAGTASVDVIATMSGAGVGFSDAALAAAAASAPGVAGAAAATAEMAAASWGTLATGGYGGVASSIATLAESMPTNLPKQISNAQSVFKEILQGEKVDNIFSGITGTVNDLAGAAVSTYSAIQGVQLQKAQIDLATQQARAAANPPMYQTTTGGMNWSMIGLGVAALLGVFLVMKKI